MNDIDILNMKKSLNDELKDYVCVFASTLNQMVNYIPLKKYEFKEKYNVTLYKDDNYKKKLKENEQWDNNLNSVLGEDKKPQEIKISESEWLEIEKITGKFEDYFNDKDVFWNITGGQRPFVMAVHKFVQNRPNDIVAYLEGNQHKMVTEKSGTRYLEPQKYDLENLTIETALNLAGVNINNFNDSKPVSDFQNCVPKADVLALFEKYKTISSKEREEFFRLNKDKDKLEVSNLKFYNDFKNLLDTYNKRNKRRPFGYILEDFTYYRLIEVISKNSDLKEKVAQIAHSVKVNPKEFEADNVTDEFDILLLTKYGQLINFECKSGGMTGDVAKSTNYSTYAVSGVYGKPILISPLLKNDSGQSKYFESAEKAIRAAQRATLEVWGIDEIEDKLNNLLK